MSDGTITREDWGEPVSFRLGIGECRQLQDAINRPRVEMGFTPLGPMSLLRLLATGDAWHHEVREVIRPHSEVVAAEAEAAEAAATAAATATEAEPVAAATEGDA